jgi:hypothetical protein
MSEWGKLEITILHSQRSSTILAIYIQINV